MSPEQPGTTKPTKNSRAATLVRFLFGLVFGVLVPAALLAAGAWGAYTLIRTAPQAERNSGAKREEQARLVEIETLAKTDQQVLVEVMGLVKSARRAAVQARVGGEIVDVAEDLQPGGIFRAGDTMLKLDPADYELEIRKLQAQVAQAESSLQIELGQQEVARAEFELLGEDIPEGDRSLVLREPQLARARADLDAAKAALENARLDLRRTELKAPFNGMVVGEDAELGVIAGTSSQLVELVGTDSFHVDLSVPVDDLRWVEMPDADGTGGSRVRVYDDQAWGPEEFREGRIVRFASNVDPESRMATLTVEIDDPLALDPANARRPKLLLNSYVRAEIDGRTVPDSFAIARRHIHDGGSVWIVDENDRLDIRDVRMVWRGRSIVLVTDNLRDGERMVLTRLSSPVQGMLLRTTTNVEVEGESPGAAEAGDGLQADGGGDA